MITFRKNQVWTNGDNKYLTVIDVKGDRILMKESDTHRIVEWSYDLLIENDNITYVGIR